MCVWLVGGGDGGGLDDVVTSIKDAFVLCPAQASVKCGVQEEGLFFNLHT